MIIKNKSRGSNKDIKNKLVEIYDLIIISKLLIK